MEDNNIVIGSFCSTAEKDTYVYPKEIPGYVAPEPQILKEDNQQFNFIYTPIEYSIGYNLDGGEIDVDLKSSYTIEDDTYTPCSFIFEYKILESSSVVSLPSTLLPD